MMTHEPYEYDSLTGLLSYSSFQQAVNSLIENNAEGVEQGSYAMLSFNIQRFKVINDLFGSSGGDSLLVYVASKIREIGGEGCLASRTHSDHFCLFVSMTEEELSARLDTFCNTIENCASDFEVVCHVGVYVTHRADLASDGMIARALLACSFVKDSLDKHYIFYHPSMRDQLLLEQEIINNMGRALADEHFKIYYQPQYNHVTGQLVGAEALVRWLHPVKGLISPGVFIPVLEKNNLITKLDMYVFEKTCAFMRRMLDSGLKPVPLSVNVSRLDILYPDLPEQMEAIRQKYDVPVEWLRVEITESAILGGIEKLTTFIEKMHKLGFYIEMDDFGSGYSSLNMLKNLELDTLKLDMRLLSDEGSNKNNGAVILTGLVRMAKWLGLPIIGEGVEHKEQADFLASIGCSYVQGFLYSRPIPEEDFYRLIQQQQLGDIKPPMQMIESMNAAQFWNPMSIETLVFNNYAGGAAVMEYRNNRMDLVRVNKKFISELDKSLTEEDVMKWQPFDNMDDHNKQIMLQTADLAVQTGEEQECETWSTTPVTGEPICVRMHMRMIAQSTDNVMFYMLIRNITQEKKTLEDYIRHEKLFRAASEQVNIYYWEYDIQTKNMLPCFRCIRDLCLPSLLHNYPESAIERGVIAPEAAERYRLLHQSIDAGLAQAEIVVPLTADKIPFRIRYTTEFDEQGNPVRAYGSAVPADN
ncbi:MAG: EAL domain-containing protein [Clostridia bacterium]|nr:EAL domain-containing protein [Clostridia bacterium]